MKTNKSWIYGLRIGVEILFLAFFVVLLYLGRIQIWLVVFGSGAFLSLLLSRFYCGWMCPMDTLFRPIRWLYRKMGIKRLAVPHFFKVPLVRFLFLVVFIGFMIVTKRMGMNIPLLGIIVVISVLVVLVFEEALWHNYICPYGTILRLLSIPAIRSVKIDEDKCIMCGKCQIVCAVHAIDTKDNKKRIIRKTDCLTCHECESSCPTDAIHYK